MQVPIIVAAGRVEFVDEPEPEVRPGYALVDVRACGICGTELSAFRGHAPQGYPVQRIGHEFSGVVLEIGPGVVDLAPGDHVVAGLGGCGRCLNCRNGQPNYCECQPRPLFAPAGIARRLVVAAGEATFALKIDPAVDFVEAALHEPLSCAMRIAERALPGYGRRAAVFGLGPMGLLAALCLQRQGLHMVAGVDVNPYRLELARAVGLETVLDGRIADVRAVLLDLTEGRGPDVAVEATGNPEVFRACAELVRIGGRVVQAGVAHTPLSGFDQAIYIRKELEVVGAKGTYPAYLPNGKQRSVDAIERGLLPLRQLAQVYRLADTQQAFEDMATGKTFKPVVIPG